MSTKQFLPDGSHGHYVLIKLIKEVRSPSSILDRYYYRYVLDMTYE